MKVIAVSGSPSPTSKSARAADHTLELIGLSDPAIEVLHLRLSEIDPGALLRGHMQDAGLSSYVDHWSTANGVVIATPIFKAAYSGLLKAGLDILPQFALAGKVVLPIGVGGSLAHALALDYALRPVLQSMGARHIVQSHLILESDIGPATDRLELSPACESSLGHSVSNFLHSLTDADHAKWLGHPRPPEAQATV